jgi:hypothetical protein
MNTLKEAYCNVKRCFICRRQDPPLHRVSIFSRIYAYQNLRIFIKKDSRSCRKHIDTERNIKIDHFMLIKTTNKSPDTQALIELLNSTSSVALKCIEEKDDPEYNSIFAPFKDLKTLDNGHCYKITKLTKPQFLNTLRMLTKLRDSKNRTIGQLLALYR